jgi:asparaginyl-tRNA synthetase
MPVVTIQDVGQHDGQEITLRGWLYNLRESGKLLFPIFRDGTGTIQGVVSLKDQPSAFEALRGLTQESSVIVTGRIRADKRAPGGFEIQITAIEVVQRVPDDTPYPIQLKEHGISGSARRARQRSCASAPRPFAPRMSTWIRRATF